MNHLKKCVDSSCPMFISRRKSCPSSPISLPEMARADNSNVNITDIFEDYDDKNDILVEHLLSTPPTPRVNEDYTNINFTTANRVELQNWFEINGVPKVCVGQKRYTVKFINDIKTLRLLAELYSNNHASAEKTYPNVGGYFQPKLTTLLEEEFEYDENNVKNYLPVNSNIVAPSSVYDCSNTSFDFSAAGINNPNLPKPSRVPSIIASLEFLNINIRNATPKKLDILVKNSHQCAVFLINEIHLNVNHIDIICPAGYKIYHSEADSEKVCYAAVLIKEELAKYTTLIFKGHFMCKVRVKLPQNIVNFSSVYRPHDISVKYGRCKKNVKDFFVELHNCQKIGVDDNITADVIAGDFNVKFDKKAKKSLNKNKYSINKKIPTTHHGRAELIYSTLATYKNMVKKSTFRTDKKNGDTYESQIDACFVSHCKLDKFKHLNLKHEIGTDGHLGQSGEINIEKINLALEFTMYSRDNATPEEICNVSYDSWEFFDDIITDHTCSNTDKAYKVHMYLERLVALLEPESIKIKKIGVFQPVYSEKTLFWRNRMNYLHKKKNIDDIYKYAYIL